MGGHFLVATACQYVIRLNLTDKMWPSPVYAHMLQYNLQTHIMIKKIFNKNKKQPSDWTVCFCDISHKQISFL